MIENLFSFFNVFGVIEGNFKHSAYFSTSGVCILYLKKSVYYTSGRNVHCALCIVHWRHSFLQEICWLIEYILLCFIIFIHLFYLFIILYLSSLCVCLSIQNTLHKHKAGFTYSQEWLISFTLRWTSINVILQLVFILSNRIYEIKIVV